MDKISVVIPVYNGEKYIRQCVGSVLCQSYRNLEILVIDDGSTDRSLEICEELSRTDGRIRLYHQENGGVSRARNYGLDLAGGEYVFFLDCDDAIHPLLLEEMIGQARARQADMAFCGCVKEEDAAFEDMVRAASREDGRPEWQTAEGDAAKEWFHITYENELSGCWGLLRRAYIGPLRFEESMANGEDTLFKYHLFCREGRTLYSPAKWYYYRMRPESATHSADHAGRDSYFECSGRIRDCEYEKGHYRYALYKETIMTFYLREKYAAARKRKDKKECRRFRETARAERANPPYRDLKFSLRFMFGCCFACYPVYVPLNRAIAAVWEWKENLRDGRKR